MFARTGPKGQQRRNAKRAQELVAVSVYHSSFCKTKRVLDGKLVGGDRLKLTNEISALIVRQRST